MQPPVRQQSDALLTAMCRFHRCYKAGWGADTNDLPPLSAASSSVGVIVSVPNAMHLCLALDMPGQEATPSHNSAIGVCCSMTHTNS